MRKMIIITAALALCLLLSFEGASQTGSICSKGPIELQKAGGAWFVSISGGDWQHVGAGWKLINDLIVRTPVEVSFQQQRSLLYIGGLLSSGLGILFAFWPYPICAVDKERGFLCETGIRSFAAAALAGIGTSLLINVEEWLHVEAVADYNAMWNLLCKKKEASD